MDLHEKHQLYFTQLVAMFHAATMQQLGKVKNPLTDKIDRDLAAAQSSIDMLDMLKEKTRGNLSPEEDRFLSQILQEVKLNYVDEANKPSPEPAQASEGGKSQ